jgi:hypothetical protein
LGGTKRVGRGRGWSAKKEERRIELAATAPSTAGSYVAVAAGADKTRDPVITQ